MAAGIARRPVARYDQGNMDLFSHNQHPDAARITPLAERIRPTQLTDVVGQRHAKGPWQLVKRAVEGTGRIPNLIFWGPPGTGKTTLARLLANHSTAFFIQVNAIDSGAKELRQIGEEARNRKSIEGRGTVLFVDEIHRLNKSQQDVLLPFSERGDFTLIGATTENPSYELNSALLSRCQVVRFYRLTHEELNGVLQRACAEEPVSPAEILSDEAREELFAMSDGDARRMLTLLEGLLQLRRDPELAARFPLSKESVTELSERPLLSYQRTGDDHYDCISAFIKSVRGSDPDAAVYYLARMLESGEDPVFIARRLVVLASEDIGNADPRGIQVAVAGLHAVEFVGLPEAAISLAQVTTYLASAPKSNASYMALKEAEKVVQQTGRVEVPLSLRSARTKLAKELGYGEGYRYSHEDPRGYIPQQFLPDSIKNEKFYKPKEIGFEKTIRQFLAWLKGVSTD